METETINGDINLFSQHINENYKSWPDYIFRGQSDSNWELETTLYRAIKDKNKKEQKKIEKNHYEKFRKNIRGRRGNNPNKLDNLELKALGQHFGLQTTLLDWSRSPYVALFFALVNPVNNSDYCSVFCLNSTCIDEINNQEANKKKKIILVEPEDDFNKRIVNQSGLFLDVQINVEFKTWINNAPEHDFVLLEKILISNKLRNDGLLMLNQMNINFSSLFPDLVGSALDANLSLKLIDHIKNTQDEIWENNKKV